MSNKVTALVGGMLLVVAFFAGTTQGCGDSGNDCTRACDKYIMCFPDAAAFAQQCKAACMSNSTGGGTCTNQTAITTAAKACLNASCADLEACLDGVPDCQGTGAGGTTGGAGSTGQGGAGGGAPAAVCATCAAANACCMALPGSNPTECTLSTADCNALSGADQTNYITGCQTVLTVGRLLPAPPAACL
jgi:hypothetical protein